MDGFRNGFRHCLPVSLSVLAYGSVLGVFAANQEVGFFQLALMNITVFAGTAQFIMVEMWQSHLPVLEMTIAVFVMNLRYFLVGASLRPVFAGHSLRQKLFVMHFVADENWAVTMAALRKGEASVAHLLGGGICLFLFWGAGTLAGHAFGGGITNPEALALDFAFTALFLALVTGLWQDRSEIPAWVVAGLTAILAEQYLPGKWYILAGGITGALTAACTRKEAL